MASRPINQLGRQAAIVARLAARPWLLLETYWCAAGSVVQFQVQANLL